MQSTAKKSNNKPISQAANSIFAVFERAMLAAAMGDAFGFPMEFFCEQKIKQSGFHLNNGDDELTFLGKSSDDTQLNLFTAEGIIYSKYTIKHSVNDYQLMNDTIVREVARAYQRWLHTQSEASIFCEEIDIETGLVSFPELNQRVEPGDTCLSALKDMQYPSDSAYNFSKGSGVTIKNLPIAMVYAAQPLSLHSLSCHQKALASFDLGFKVAQITHGHPIAKLTAATIATILFFNLQRGPSSNTLLYSMAMTKELIISNLANILRRGFDIQRSHIEHIIELLDNDYYNGAKCVSAYGQGWFADEALAMALHCALYAETFEQLLVMGACHSGDSDSTCSLAASIFVSARGGEDMPDYLLEKLELKEVVKGITEKLTY
ncbi:MAG: ADP-ribosylglycohydrolase family protein [Paraglaciecola sp.]|uniref:ADP-ribosylglycohydrolase family protein n=1 Tax=Paraglaciecola sp. TaxID=1920173 RepID=UPI003299E0B3